MATQPAPSNRHRSIRLRSVRAVMVVIIPMVVSLAWIARIARTQRQHVAAIERAGGHVGYRYRWPLTRPAESKWARRALTWLGERLGRDYLETATCVQIYNSAASHAELTHVAGLGRLEALSVHSERIADVDLDNLRDLSRLHTLTIEAPHITDDGLRRISAVPGLRVVLIGEADITDDGLEALAKLRQLTDLFIVDTPVTERGVRKLQHTLPALRVLRYHFPLVRPNNRELTLVAKGAPPLATELNDALLRELELTLGELDLEVRKMQERLPTLRATRLPRIQSLGDLSILGSDTPPAAR
jgi:hypothetical protein